MFQLKAYAKINLSLEVLRKLDSGYHEIISIMQLVDLHDTISFQQADDLHVESDHPELAADGDANLVFRAARALQEVAGTKRGALIKLEKKIPLAAGLGGGSSDAAMTLVGLCNLWDLHVPRDVLRSVALSLGSDVPFFLDGPTALVEGRGERITRTPSPPSGWAVLAYRRYDIPNKTRTLYSSLNKHDLTDGTLTRRLIAALLDDEFPDTRLLFNAFERAAESVYEDFHRLRSLIERAAGRDAHLSGSGPTMFVLFREHEEARASALCDFLGQHGVDSYLTRIVTRGQT